MVMKTNEISFPSRSNNVILQTLESKCICTLKNTQKSVAIFESPGQVYCSTFPSLAFTVSPKPCKGFPHYLF